MNILFVHQFFTTESEPGEVRHVAMFKYMLEKGFNFTVIGGALNYMTGKYFEDFKGLFWKKEIVEDRIKLIRTYVTPTYRKGFLWKLICYISFLFTSVIASLQTGKCDIVLTTSPSLFTALAGYIISRIKRVPFILEIRDLWPKVAVEMGVVKNRFIIWFASSLELFLYKKSQRIVVITEGYRDYIISRGIEPSKISVVYNGVDEWMLDYSTDTDELPEELKDFSDKFLVMYVGAIGQFNYLQELLEAVELLDNQEDFAFILIGDGGERKNLMNYVKEKGLKNFLFPGSMKRTELANLLDNADLTISIYPRIPTGKVLLQNKVLDYLAMGKAVLLISEDGDTSRIIEEAGCGFRLDKGTVILAEKLNWCLQNKELCKEMGKKGREYVKVNLNRKKLASDMANIMMVELC